MTNLIAKSVVYYSKLDEEAFFDWIGRISCIVDIKGVSTELIMKVDQDRVNDVELRELLALFFRYSIDMRQLLIFENSRNTEWFSKSGMYWHDLVFGSP